MRVTCVVDDTAQRGSPFLREHGVSFLVEGEGGRLLFDTGGTGRVLLHNLALIGLDSATLDALAISHAHNDHTGGLPALVEQTRPGVPLYANPDLFRERYARRDGKPVRVGPSATREMLASRLALNLDSSPQEVLPGVWTTGEILDRPEPQGASDYHLMREGDALIADAYRDDMALVLRNSAGDGLVLLCGCCHAGLLNTLAHVERTFEEPIAAIVGGLHLTGATGCHLQKIATVLSAMPALLGARANHCTGQAAVATLTHRLGPEVVQPCPAGTILEF